MVKGVSTFIIVGSCCHVLHNDTFLFIFSSCPVLSGLNHRKYPVCSSQADLSLAFDIYPNKVTRRNEDSKSVLTSVQTII